jgi:two-component system cell cycle response regulator
MIDTSDSQVMLLPEEELAVSCRVLIVDDDELVLKRFSAVLIRGGYETYTATSGAEALRILAETPCQIVVTDWHMPEMDGLELCSKLRSKMSDGYIYILLVTVRCAGRDIVAGLAAGADDYVIKGATAQELLARVGVGRRITRLERSLRISNQENRRMSITDALTGVRNRRFLMKYMPRELERARLNDSALSVLSCDIDHFKRVNDRFGHEAGDEVLQEFAKRAVGCIRKATDWIARTGGEEFVIVLPAVDLTDACGIAERLRQALAAAPVATGAGPLSITVSIGVCALDTAEERCHVSVQELLRAADRGLYTSKRLGRDRTTTMTVGGARLGPATLAGGPNEIG